MQIATKTVTLQGTCAEFYNKKDKQKVFLYLLGLQHLVVKDVRDAVPHHLQPAGAVGHDAAIPVHDVSCCEAEEVTRTSFITRVKPIKLAARGRGGGVRRLRWTR